MANNESVVVTITNGTDGDDALIETVLYDFSETFEERSVWRELHGHGGDDWVQASVNARGYAGLTVGTSLTGDDGDDQLTAVVRALSDFEKAHVQNSLAGGAGNDELTATAKASVWAFGNAGAVNSLDGGDGDDLLTATADAVAWEYGIARAVNALDDGDGSDELTATARARGMNGADGRVSNTLSGGGGDRMDVTAKASGFTSEATITADGGDGDDRVLGVVDAPGYHHANARCALGGDGDDHLKVTVIARGAFGGFATNTLSGGDGDDILLSTVDQGAGFSRLSGGDGDDRLTVVGGDGNTLDGGAGVDWFAGGAGADRFLIDAEDLTGDGVRVDGREGMDTLVVDFNLDLTRVANGALAHIEVVDLKDGAARSLKLNAADVWAMTDADHDLTVLGDGADAVTLVGRWSIGAAGAEAIEYTCQGASIFVDADIAHVFIA